QVGQTIPGIPGSTHFRNRWVKSFPEFPSSQTIPAIGKVGQMISGIFTSYGSYYPITLLSRSSND
ncbi:MAG: hypothetical protein ACK5YS_00760, partial [bacterium]